MNSIKGNIMTKRIVGLLLALALLVGVRTASAQATLNSTTLSAAVTAAQLSVTVASTSNISTGYIAYVDREAMLVTAVNTTTSVLTVQRGYNGTFAAAHAASALTYVDRPNYFYATDPSGACTAAAQVVTPSVNVQTGNFSACVNGRWQSTHLTPATFSTWPRTPVFDAAYTVKQTDVFVAYTSLSSARSVTLPSATQMAGHIVIIKDEIGSANTYNITVVGTINGSSNATINTAYGVARYYSNGVSWYVW